jgi:dual oxidase
VTTSTTRSAEAANTFLSTGRGTTGRPVRAPTAPESRSDKSNLVGVVVNVVFQLNQVSSWIDGSFIYSTSEPWVNTMRSFRNGTFSTDATGKMPVRNSMRVPLFNNPVPHVMKMLSTERLFRKYGVGGEIRGLTVVLAVLGDPRTNQNPALLTVSILFFRWHNVVAERVQKEHPDWSDEDVFQRARRIVVATVQNIVAYEYIPAFLGQPLPEYTGYKQDVHPGITHVFQSAAFRYGHSLIPPGLFRRDGECNFDASPMGLRLCATWWDSNVRRLNDIVLVVHL